MNVFQKRDIEKVQESLVTAINPSKKIKDLERRFKFSETFENQVSLADAYLNEGMYEEAIKNYRASLKDVFVNDFYAISKLVEAYCYAADYDNAIHYVDKIKDNPSFRKSKASFLYGLALEKTGGIELAEEYLRIFDAPYSNFNERLELSRFLVRQNKIEEAKEVLQEMISESEHMSRQSFRTNREVIKKAKEEFVALT